MRLPHDKGRYHAWDEPFSISHRSRQLSGDRSSNSVMGSLDSRNVPGAIPKLRLEALPKSADVCKSSFHSLLRLAEPSIRNTGYECDIGDR
jgi:hypothetical protein